MGTPHGGSNADLGPLNVVGGILEGLNANSEAVRDLRTSYTSLPEYTKGTYLFGGRESNLNSLSLGFNNVDVNCDGLITSDSITGLNNKILPNIPYSCIIGTALGLSDGVVSTYSANLNNQFANLNADIFKIFSSHFSLTNEFECIIKGMDEPNYPNYAYKVALNQLYYGNLSVQTDSKPNIDFDYYTVDISSNGKLNIQVFNIPSSVFRIEVFNSNNVSIYPNGVSTGKSYMNIDVPVNTGKYYVVLSGIPDANTWKSQYAFQLGFTAVTPNYGSCFTNLTAPTGSFSDGSGSSNYLNNVNCSWLINPSGVSSITLRFNNFNTESINDVVNVYDGNDDSYPLLGTFSGSTIPGSITSTGSTMFVKFTTNATVTAAGWDASYTSTITQNPVQIPSYTTGYKYWFDGDIGNSVTVTQNYSNTEPINTLLQPPANFKNGFHTVSLMAKQSNNQWSVPVTHNFYYSTSGGTALYEYWYDSNYVNKKTVQITGTNNLELTNQMLSADTLVNGYHQLNVRYKPNGGMWSLVQSSSVFKQGNATVPSSQVTQYEYWYDTSYSNKQIVTVTNTEDFTLTNQLLGATALANGYHQFNFRFKNNTSFWSAVQSSSFFKQGNASIAENQVVQYEYWYDNNYSNKTIKQITSSADLTLNNELLEGSSLNNGFHQISFRFKANNNLWSGIENGFVFKRGNDVNTIMDVKKIRYWFDSSFSQKKEIITTGQNGIINNLIDCSNLTMGKHAFNYQTMDNGNVWSSILVDSFMSKYFVNGRIINPNNLPIPGVTVKVNTIDSLYTTADGTYNYVFSTGGNYTITPSKNNDIVKASGVNVLDVLLMQKHITGAQLLNTPYKLIAADVNNTNSINIFDVLFTKRLILGIDTTFVGSRLWAFTDSSYVFPDPTNPGSYINSITINNLSGNQIDKTLIGVKLGDVNIDLIPTVGVNRISRQGIPVKLYHDTIYTSKIENQIRLCIKAKNFKDLVGMQFTLKFNKNVLAFSSIENKNITMDYGLQKAKDGSISFVWTDSAANVKTLPDGTVLFDLTFNKIAEVDIEDIDINSEITDALAYDISYVAHDVIKGEGIIIGNKASLYAHESLEVTPNPSKGLVRVKIISREDKSVTLLLTDLYGKMIMQKRIGLVTGINEFLLNLNEPRTLMQATYFLKALGLDGKDVQPVIIAR